MMQAQEETSIPKRYNKLIFFLIQIAYWAAYYAKWKSEKDIPFSLGVVYAFISLPLVHILFILTIVQLYTPYTTIDNTIGLISNDILNKDNKLLIIIALIPFALCLEWVIIKAIYRRASKKELVNYFRKMSPHHQSLGKKMFITYSFCSIILVFVFGIQLTNKREALQENDNALIRQERLEQIQQSIQQQDSLSIK